MNGDSDPTLHMSEVSERFLAAEEHLRNLAAAAKELSDEATHLEGARRSVGEVAGSVSELTETLEGLTVELHAATQAIQQTDPAKIVRRLDEVSSEISSAQGRLSELAGSSKRTEDAATQMLSGVASSRKLLLLVLVVAIVAAVLAGLSLVM